MSPANNSTNPAIYWYPVDGGALEALDLEEGLTDINELPSGEAEDGYAASGSPSRSFLGARFRVRLVLERFGFAASELEESLMSLHAHLFRGGWIGFSRNHAKTWASLSTTAASRGDTTLYTPGNGYELWSPSATLEEDDRVVIESVDPEANREIRRVGTLSVSPPINLPLASGLVYTYAGNQFARWRDFYPWLWLPKDQIGRPFVTHDHRRNFTLDVTLEYCLPRALEHWDGGTTDFPDFHGGLP